MSFSFFLLLVPGIVETLTRVPAAHPLAQGPESPLVRLALLSWVVVFIVGFAVQVWTIGLPKNVHPPRGEQQA